MLSMQRCIEWFDQLYVQLYRRLLQLHGRLFDNIYYNNHNLKELPEIPYNTRKLYCCDNQLTVLPELPDCVFRIECDNNNLIEIIKFPSSLKYLFCSNNQLTGIPELPSKLEILWCDNNKLTALPSSLTQCKQLRELRCSGNNFNEETNRILNTKIPVQQKIKELDENGLLEYNNDFILK
jgi:Leucine-rich repeat (LRR) protein